MKKLYAVLLAASLLGGCSATNNIITGSLQTWDAAVATTSELSTQLRSQQIKAVPIDQLAFQMVSIDSDNKIQINADSPVVAFPEGNSFVAPLFLPQHIDRFTFTLESNAGRTVFVPSVVFLNDNLQAISRLDDAQFNAQGFFSLEKEFTSESAQQIRYILVYSQDSDLDGKSELIDLAREYELTKGKELPEQSYPKIYSKHSPIGNVSITLKDVYFSAQAIHSEMAVESGAGQTITFSKATVADTPTILADSEAFYLQQISKAVEAGDGTRAKSLVEEAERAGSTKARAYYLQALDIQQ